MGRSLDSLTRSSLFLGLVPIIALAFYTAAHTLACIYRPAE